VVSSTLSAALRALVEKTAAQTDNRDHQGVELTLAPQELGRIRMTLDGADGQMTVTVHADRAETLDLLRRNIDMLAQDFRDLGYSQTNFAFGGGSAGADPPPVPAPPSSPPTEAFAFVPTFFHPIPSFPAEGLALRL
jgi:hypothetical protein